MRLKALFLSIVVVCGVLPHRIAAQTRSSRLAVVPGTRVRVKTPTLVAPLVANFLEQRGDTLVFIEDGSGRGVWSFDIDQIERLERTAGDAGRNTAPMLRYTGIGAAAGLVVGVIFASVASPSDDSKKYSPALTGALGAGIGAGIGALVGSRVKAEHWITVPLPGRPGLTFDGQKLGIRVPLPGSR